MADTFRQGAGRLCLDFTRTLRARGTDHAVEELTDGPALSAWVGQCGPVAPVPGSVVPEPIVRDAQQLREAVYALVEAARSAGGPEAAGEAPRERVNQAATRTVPVPALSDSGELRWYANDPVTGTLALVARDALELVTSPAVTRIRACADPSCNALFLDLSRPGRRRWCSMDSCGNRAKKQRRRA
ncbi:CGNR zinc finger domain-containing protein [Dactylosporangium matsuzakiense]|nr:ABATE domain-containing protein [Dactylosporangium matsuzakiense]UWZ41769.1 ABATE domain-containing protein [Dactylosporangium matsuzakiense]